MTISNGPCPKDCPNRSPECHGKCEKYQAFVKEREKIRAELLGRDACTWNGNEKFERRRRSDCGRKRR